MFIICVRQIVQSDASSCFVEEYDSSYDVDSRMGSSNVHACLLVLTLHLLHGEAEHGDKLNSQHWDRG